MPHDPRRLLVPDTLVGDPRAFELVCGWATGDGKITVMTRTGTWLDQNPAIWGELLAAIGGNIALSLKRYDGGGPGHHDGRDQGIPGSQVGRRSHRGRQALPELVNSGRMSRYGGPRSPDWFREASRWCRRPRSVSRAVRQTFFEVRVLWT
jgi:Domain of unknown function (DUF5076)